MSRARLGAVVAGLLLPAMAAAAGPAAKGAPGPAPAAKPAPLPPPAPSVDRRFGDWLLSKGDAYRAIGAYERYLFLVPNAKDADLVRYRIALAYLTGAQYAAARRTALALAAGRPAVLHAARLLAGRALYGEKRYADAADLLAEDPDPYAKWLVGWSHLKTWDFTAARRTFGSLATPKGRAMTKALAPPLDLAYRSPVLAGILSIVPGLGHVYLGRYGIAASALLWNGAFAWGMVETFRGHQWGLFTLLAVLESVWYFGTIYGAVIGAERFDRDAVLNELDALAARLPPPGPPPQPALPGEPPLQISVSVPIP